MNKSIVVLPIALSKGFNSFLLMVCLVAVYVGDKFWSELVSVLLFHIVVLINLQLFSHSQLQFLSSLIKMLYVIMYTIYAQVCR